MIASNRFAHILLLFGFVSTAGVGPVSGAEYFGRGIVQTDASIKVGIRKYRLYGIYIPRTNRTCSADIRPSRCGSRAFLALDFKVRGFVYCDGNGRYSDGSHSGVCRVRRNDVAGEAYQDLAAWLLNQGWAVALPDAPFEYAVLEEIAKVNRRGIWGFQADSIH